VATRQDDNKKKSIAVVKTIGMVLLFGLLVFAAARVIVGSSGSEYSSETLTVDTEGEILYAIPSQAVADMTAYETGIAVLTDNDMLYFDAAGSITRSAQHEYRSPAFAFYDREFLVYDRGTPNYRLEINAAVYNEYTANADLLTAAVGTNGRYAVATLSDGGFQSKLYVYAADGSLQFEWGSAKHFITHIALSDSKDRYAVALAGSESAGYVSQIQVFERGVTQPLYTLSYKDVTVLAIDFMKDDTLALVTDSFVAFVEDGVAETKLEYTVSSLLSFDVQHAEEISVLLSSGYVDEVNHRVFMWDKNGKCILDPASVSPDATHLSITKKYFAVADEKNITVYDRNGAFTGEARSAYSIDRLQVVGARVFCLHENGFSVWSVHSRLAQTEDVAN